MNRHKLSIFLLSIRLFILTPFVLFALTWRSSGPILPCVKKVFFFAPTTSLRFAHIFFLSRSILLDSFSLVEFFCVASISFSSLSFDGLNRMHDAMRCHAGLNVYFPLSLILSLSLPFPPQKYLFAFIACSC